VTAPPPAGSPSPQNGGAGGRPRWAKDAAKYLLEDEPPVLATRRHWAVLAGPVARFLPVFALGGWLLLLDPRNRVTSSVGLLVVLAAIGLLALRVAEWWMRHFIVTRRRVLLTSGVIVRTVTLLPLGRITDLTWQETLFGQLLGYGTFRFESAGQHQALSEITFLPKADVLYRRVSVLLFSPRPPADARRPPQTPTGTQPIPGLPPPRG
jgi:membrane protein YdbS with pleckstrin-like domain